MTNVFFDISGKKCVVTGAASGIGRAIAERFAQAGADVCLTDLQEEAVDEISRTLNADAGKTCSSRLDVSDAGECEAFYRDLLQRWPTGVDVLVNNAGIGFKGTALETQIEDLNRLERVNMDGVFNLSRCVLPEMQTRRSGVVINMASVGGICAVRDRVAYCATKFAVVGLTKSMALDHAQDNVRFNCICPARVHTPFVDQIIQSYDDPAAAFDEMSSTQPLGRMARPDEIAAAAHYLASDEASFITGTALCVDGGFSVGQ